MKTTGFWKQYASHTREKQQHKAMRFIMQRRGLLLSIDLAQREERDREKEFQKASH